MTLVQRLEEELKYEKEAGSDSVPDFVTEFTAQGVWEVGVSFLFVSRVRVERFCDSV